MKRNKSFDSSGLGMALRREILSYIGTGAIGGMIGYYAGVKELLGIQQESRPRQPGKQGSTSPTPEVITDPPETPPPETTEPTATPRTTTEMLSVPFTEDFSGGINGWETGLRYRTGEEREPDNPPAGEGSYSGEYGGSVRLRVEGGPSTIGVGRTLDGLPSGATVSVTYYIEASSPQPGKVGTPVFAPDGDDMAETWAARNEGSVDPGEHTVTGTVEQSYPANTEIRVTADVWPGSFTAYITRISIE
jgi:hypothetical protein